MKWFKYMLIPVLLTLIIAVGISASALTVAPSKTTYYPGEQLVISGTATPSALVSIVVYNPSNQLVALDQVKAGNDGSFTKTVLTFPAEPTNTFPLGTYTIIVKDTATNEEQTLHVTLEQPKAVISGTVTSSEGTPVGGAVVTVKLGTVTVLITQTDDNGNFAATVYDTGNYTIVVSAEGYASATANVVVSQLPSTQSIQLTLKKQTLSIEIVSLKADGKPVSGIVREGAILAVEAKVKYGDAELSNATVKGYLTSAVREAAGMPPLEFELTYSSEAGAYVGSVTVPSPGVDRTCTVKVEATYEDMSAHDSMNFITLVNTPKNLKDINAKILNVTTQINKLNTIINGLKTNLNNFQTNFNTLQTTVNNLQTTLNTLQTTVKNLQSQIGNLAAKQDLSNLQSQLTQLQTQLKDLQKQLNNIQQQVNAVSGAKSVAYGAIGIGVVAIIIAIAALAYINKKIQG